MFTVFIYSILEYFHTILICHVFLPAFILKTSHKFCYTLEKYVYNMRGVTHHGQTIYLRWYFINLKIVQ